MIDRNPEYVILYILSGCTAVLIATLARLFALEFGTDNFSANIVFLLIVAISIAFFLSIQLILKNLINPYIGKLLLKIPYFRNKIEFKLHAYEVIEDSEVQQISLSLEDIRNEQLHNKAQEQHERLNIALNYARKIFASYASDEHIQSLCDNLKIYADKLNLGSLYPIRISKELSSIDIFHFGWNIWNHFKVGKQIDIAHFLKRIFPDILKDVEIETIKRHLKDDELKGIIKIQESLL
jgi:hypothetical protein